MAEAVERIDNFFEESDDYTYGLYGSPAAPSRPLVETVPETIPQQEPKQEPERKIKSLPRTEPAPRTRRSGRVVFLLSAFIFLFGTLNIVISYSKIYARKAQINSLNEELEEAETTSTMLDTDTEETMTLEDLYEYATIEMGMENASGSDIVYIHLDNHSYTEVTAPEQSTGAEVTFHWFS